MTAEKQAVPMRDSNLEVKRDNKFIGSIVILFYSFIIVIY